MSCFSFLRYFVWWVVSARTAAILLNASCWKQHVVHLCSSYIDFFSGCFIYVQEVHHTEVTNVAPGLKSILIIVFNWNHFEMRLLNLRINFCLYCGLFFLILVVFLVFVSSFTTFRPNFTKNHLKKSQRWNLRRNVRERREQTQKNYQDENKKSAKKIKINSEIISCFILSERLRFPHCQYNVLNVVHAFPISILTSLLVDEILLPRFMNWSTNFKVLLSNDSKNLDQNVWKSFFFFFNLSSTKEQELLVACSKLCSRNSTCEGVFARSGRSFMQSVSIILSISFDSKIAMNSNSLILLFFSACIWKYQRIFSLFFSGNRFWFVYIPFGCMIKFSMSCTIHNR